jgi:hypothetical protein
MLDEFLASGLEKCYMDSYVSSGLNDFENINAGIQAAADRCAQLGILSGI